MNEFFLKHGFMTLPNALTGHTRGQLRQDCILRCLHRCSNNGVADTLAVDLSNDMHVALIHHAAALLEQQNFPDIRYIAGAIIPKYPGEPRRGWHVDWWDWNSPETQQSVPAQVGVIFYLDRAHYADGGLLAVCGSHRQCVPNHLGCLDSLEPRRDEVCVPAEIGDAVVIDSRLLHAVSARQTLIETRVAITLWFMVGWSTLSEQVQSSTMLCMSPGFKKPLGNLYPEYTGTLAPKPHVKIPQFRTLP